MNVIAFHSGVNKQKSIFVLLVWLIRVINEILADLRSILGRSKWLCVKLSFAMTTAWLYLLR